MRLEAEHLGHGRFLVGQLEANLARPWRRQRHDDRRSATTARNAIDRCRFTVFHLENGRKSSGLKTLYLEAARTTKLYWPKACRRAMIRTPPTTADFRRHQDTPQAMHSGQPRILIVRLSAIGDTIHAMPVLCALRDQFPNAFLGWVVEGRSGDLLREHKAAG